MVKELDAPELRDLMRTKRDELELVDVRESFEYAQFHIKGSRHIPLADVMSRIDEIDWNRDVIFICRSGNRSGIAARSIAAQLGKSSANLRFGLQVCLTDGGSEFLEIPGQRTGAKA